MNGRKRRDIRVAVEVPMTRRPLEIPRSVTIWHAQRAPMGLARRLHLLGLVTPLLALEGCIVTSAPTYSAPDQCPPSFVQNEADPPVSEFKKFDATAKSLEFDATVSVRSCAVTKQLEGRLFFDNKLTNNVPVIPNGALERTASFKLALEPSSAKCHKIEYLVTSQGFSGSASDFRTPAVQGDLASIVWWIDITDGAGHSIDTCPGSE
jgi:hypothetical protein